MTTRKIITIDEAKCNGCGNCISGCAEGALQLINGKAKLVKEQFCDGFGDCIGTCPSGALKIEEKAAPDFNIDAVRRNLLETQGIDAVKRMEQANQAHDTLPQWPVQLHLVQPGAPFFNHRELVVLSTCAPVASADVHWRFLKGRSVVVACPKLDNTERYAAKLGEIFKNTTLPKVLIVRMEVPCCGGLTRIVQEARRLSQRQDLIIEEVTVGRSGDVLATVPL
ncbi:MAG TPA: 4Fe-4S ferredoxin [Verrucomicrobia bacterium]|nr:4Fe-4S ferredoxin [Verrucomicrobiota bacterium]